CSASRTTPTRSVCRPSSRWRRRDGGVLAVVCATSHDPPRERAEADGRARFPTLACSVRPVARLAHWLRGHYTRSLAATDGPCVVLLSFPHRGRPSRGHTVSSRRCNTARAIASEKVARF